MSTTSAGVGRLARHAVVDGDAGARVGHPRLGWWVVSYRSEGCVAAGMRPRVVYGSVTGPLAVTTAWTAVKLFAHVPLLACSTKVATLSDRPEPVRPV
jgi:hypothetical protein